MTPFYNAQHSPFGAFASFTLGFRGPRGGLGLERGAPADEAVFIGRESPADAGLFEALPFFDSGGPTGAEAFTSADEDEPTMGDHFLGKVQGVRVQAFPEDAIGRRLGLATDTWTADDLSFRVVSAGEPVPDPADPDTDPEQLKRLVCPAVIAELTLDNTRCDRDRKVFFGFAGGDPDATMRQFADGRVVGVAQGRTKGIAVSAHEERTATGQSFDPEAVLRPVRPENLGFAIGPLGLITTVVPAGKKVTVRYAIGFFRGGPVTLGEEAAYLYTRFFDGLESVCAHALENAEATIAGAEALDARLDAAGLPEDRRWQVAHAAHSYYGSTELLDRADTPEPLAPGVSEGRTPTFVVNEGEYRMMNTFDLTVDMLFFGLDFHPWGYRDALDRSVQRYSYRDEVKFPGDVDAGGKPVWRPGGLSFTHDHGICNRFTPEGHSCYELENLTGCFSHMTAEQLTNFVVCAAVIAHRSGDRSWVQGHRGVLQDCLDSLENRDHHDPAQRNGLVGSDSSRCGELGAEITTYDSLDESLGQTRNNSYMAVKTWAAYALLGELFEGFGDADRAERARAAAGRAAETIASAVLPGKTLPSILFEGHDDPIISTIEGLAYPAAAGAGHLIADDGPYAGLIRVLKQHMDAALVRGTCLFGEGPHAGAWKLSATTTNSWLSKIYLNQHVHHDLLGAPRDTPAAAEADAAHVRWLTHPTESWWCWSDQCFDGVPRGSRFYPRGVTSWLWVQAAEASKRPGASKRPETSKRPEAAR